MTVGRARPVRYSRSAERGIRRDKRRNPSPTATSPRVTPPKPVTYPASFWPLGEQTYDQSVAAGAQTLRTEVKRFPRSVPGQRDRRHRVLTGSAYCRRRAR